MTENRTNKQEFTLVAKQIILHGNTKRERERDFTAHTLILAPWAVKKELAY